MNPIKTAVALFAFDAVIIVMMVLMLTGCVTVNVNIMGKNVVNVDTPYKTVAPWIDAGGDVMAEGDADMGAEVMVPLSPPEGAFGPIQDIEVPE